VVGHYECGIEKTRFCASELEVGSANGAKPQSGTRRCVRSGMYSPHAVTDAVSEDLDRLVANRGEERVEICEVSVRGVRDDTDHARHFTQHDCVRPA
jgi:hypothetical protein